MHCTAYLILGSNIGDRQTNLSSASSLLSANDLSIAKKSKLYNSQAWGKEDQESFLNQALEIETSLSPIELLERCLQVEGKLGRKREEKWGARIIDIDIAYYENLIINVDELTIPQRNLEKRNFALIPLSEICGQKKHPLILKTNEELLSSCTDSLNVHVLDA